MMARVFFYLMAGLLGKQVYRQVKCLTRLLIFGILCSTDHITCTYYVPNACHRNDVYPTVSVFEVLRNNLYTNAFVLGTMQSISSSVLCA